MSSLINKAAAKKYLLERAKALRPSHPFTRVSAESLENLDLAIRNLCDSHIRQHPAVGQTLKF
jgi:hypothetical protein